MKSFYKDLQNIASASGPMPLLTVAFSMPDGSKWKRQTDNALDEFNAIGVDQAEVKYSQDRIARAALGKRKC
jgi:hypothetical protein